MANHEIPLQVTTLADGDVAELVTAPAEADTKGLPPPFRDRSA
jgi:hypothetical protein